MTKRKPQLGDILRMENNGKFSYAILLRDCDVVYWFINNYFDNYNRKGKPHIYIGGDYNGYYDNPDYKDFKLMNQ